MENKKDIKRILNIHDHSFFALACYSLMESIISDWYCQENNISKKEYIAFHSSGLYQSIEIVKRRLQEKKIKNDIFWDLLRDIQNKRTTTNDIRHDYYSISFDYAMGFGSDLLSFVNFFKKFFSYSCVSSKDLMDFKEEIQKRRNDPEFIKGTMDYYNSYNIGLSKLMDYEESYKVQSLELEKNEDILKKMANENAEYLKYKKIVEELRLQIQENPISQEELSYMRELSGFAINRRKYEKSIMLLSPEQAKVVESVDINKNTYINGGAGTGKTLVLVKLIEKLLNEDINASFVFIAFTNTLVNYLKYIAPLLNKDIAKKIEENAFTLANLKWQTHNHEVDEPKAKFDYVFVDEIQDFSTEELIDIKEFSRKSLIFAGDTNQTIYKKDRSLEKAGIKVEEIYCLHKNYRSTIQLNSLAEKYKQIVIKHQKGKEDSFLQDDGATNFSFRSGMPVKCSLVIDTAAEAVKRVKEIITLGEYDENSICVLTPSIDEAYKIKQLLKENKFNVSFYRDKEKERNGLDFQQPGVKVSTIHLAKGVDFPYVLFCTTGFHDGKNNYELVYTAITRATDRLEVYLTKDDFIKHDAVGELARLIMEENIEEI